MAGTDADARARKVAFYLGVNANIQGDGDLGYTVSPDSPLVPGFKGPNPYKWSGGQDVFLDFEIAVPEDVAILTELVAVVDEADRLRVLHAEIGDRVGELRNGTGRVLPFPTT
ncbi:MAG: hypothetical protein ACLQFR_03170 [Streptosporangiaceae bacterium]